LAITFHKTEVEEVLNELTIALLLLFGCHCRRTRSLADDCHHDCLEDLSQHDLDGFASHESAYTLFVVCKQITFALHLSEYISLCASKEPEHLFVTIVVFLEQMRNTSENKAKEN